MGSEKLTSHCKLRALSVHCDGPLAKAPRVTSVKTQQMKHFEKTFVINLPFKRDRLSKFLAKMPESIGPIEVWQAVHGDTVRAPAWWTAGNGAWCCFDRTCKFLSRVTTKA